MINAYVDTLRPVPAHLVEEVAREFQLDEVPPISGNGSSSSAQQAANAQALYDGLNELLGRLRHLTVTPTSERKS
jgi:hypothetical protein